MNTEVGFNEKYTRLSLEYDYLKEESANLVELYNHLVAVVGPNVETQYMVQVGMLEYRVFELTIELRRWQRRLTLRQAVLNRGEKPDYMAIERQLDAEFEEFKRKVAVHHKEIQKAADKWRREKMSDHEMTEIRTQYLAAVKRLHPDINAELTEAAKELWERIQDAYRKKEWNSLKFLVGLVDGMVAGKERFENTPDGMSRLETGCARLRGVCADVRVQTAAVRAEKPLCYEEFLQNTAEVKARQDVLNEQIGDIEGRIAECEEAWRDECDGE